MNITKFFLAALLSVTLMGCANYPVVLDEKGQEFPGPLALNGKRPSILGSCNGRRNGCDLIFVDLNGHQQDAFRINRELDEFAAKLEPMKPWVKHVSVSDTKSSDKSLPYEMFLLTISPEIVLVVPREKNFIKSCGAVFANGCVQSKGFAGHSYWYKRTPTIKEGSFWFSPQSNGFKEIKNIISEIVINVDGAIVRLTPNSGVWQVSRDR